MVKDPNGLGCNFYRDQLNAQGKQFYDSIEKHFYKKFTEKISVRVTNHATAASDCFAAYKAVRDDHPEFFFLGNQSEYTQQGTCGQLKCTILYDAEKIPRIQLQMRKKICRFLNGTAYRPLLEQQRLVYERVAKCITYVDHNDVRDHNVVGPILTNSGVCEGYNALLLLCFRRLKIPCIKVYGKSSSGNWHCWTIAWLNGSAVHCDVTWDMPKDGIVLFDYFNLSDRQISQNHFCFQSGAIPKCTSEELNYFRIYGYSFNTQQAFLDYFKNHGLQNLAYVQLDFACSYKDLMKAVRKAIRCRYGNARYRIYINDTLKTAVIVTV